MSSHKSSNGRVVVPPDKGGKGRIVGFAIGAAIVLGLIVALVWQAGGGPARTKPLLSEAEGVAPHDVHAVPVAPDSGAESASGAPDSRIDGRTVPPELAEKSRSWSPESSEFRLPEPGEEAPVRAHNVDTYDPTNPAPPPNPFIPPKRHLTEEDTRAGLDPLPER